MEIQILQAQISLSMKQDLKMNCMWLPASTQIQLQPVFTSFGHILTYIRMDTCSWLCTAIIILNSNYSSSPSISVTLQWQVVSTLHRLFIIFPLKTIYEFWCDFCFLSISPLNTLSCFYDMSFVHLLVFIKQMLVAITVTLKFIHGL